MNAFRKTYLGDGVYAEFDGWHIWLSVEDGINTTNRIALEPYVLDALDLYRASLQPKPESDAAPQG